MSRHVLVGVGLVLRSALLAGAVAVAAIAWRLTQGPLAVDLVVPYLESALAGVIGASNVRIGSAALVWVQSTHHLELHAHHVRLTNPEGAQAITIPSVAIGLQPRALLRGAIRVSSVALIEPRIRLIRAPDGRFVLAGEDGEEIGVLPSLSDAGRVGAAGRAMPKVGIRDGAVTLFDRVSGETWEGLHVNLDLHEREGVLLGRIGGRFARGVGVRARPVTATVVFHPTSRRVAVPEFALALAGGATLRLRGRSAPVAGGHALLLKAQLADVPARDLGRYWPESTASAARRWVMDNVRGGRVRDARARLAAAIPADAGELRVDSVAGSLAFEGVTVRYLETMPMATELRGTGRYVGGGGRFVITQGNLEGLELARGRLGFTPPATQPPRLVVDLAARGALARALALLAREPVRITRALGREADDFAGKVDARVRLDVPLTAPAADNVGVTATATLRDLALSRVAGDWSLRRGDFDLKLGGRAVEMSGTAEVEGVPVSAVLWAPLGAAAGRQLDLQARLGDADRQRLGFAVADWLTGPVAATVRIVSEDATTSTVDVDADLAPAAVKLPVLGIDKRAQAPGRLQATLRLSGEVVAALESGRLTVGGTAISARAARSDSGKTWGTIDVEARLPPAAGATKGGQATLALRPAGSSHRFDLASDDAGVLLRAMGYSDGRGGRLTFGGTADLLAPSLAFEGRLHVVDFTLTRSPILARLFTLTSLSGIARALDGDGIAFDQLDGSVALRGSELTLTRITAGGPSLALTLDGTVERTTNRVALRGALVPSYYGLNTAAARIPLVGKLVTGVHGEGVQVIAFRVDGPAGAPEVHLDPAASLAPGVVRDLLGMLPGRGRR